MSDIPPIPPLKDSVDGLYRALELYESEIIASAKLPGEGGLFPREPERRVARAKLTAAIVSFAFAAVKEAAVIAARTGG